MLRQTLPLLLSRNLHSKHQLQARCLQVFQQTLRHCSGSKTLLNLLCSSLLNISLLRSLLLKPVRLRKCRHINPNRTIPDIHLNRHRPFHSLMQLRRLRHSKQ